MFVTIVVNRRILDDPLDSFGNYGNTRNKFIDTYIIEMILNVSGSPTMTETIDRIVKESMEGPDDDAHYRFKVCIPGQRMVLEDNAGYKDITTPRSSAIVIQCAWRSFRAAKEKAKKERDVTAKKAQYDAAMLAAAEHAWGDSDSEEIAQDIGAHRFSLSGAYDSCDGSCYGSDEGEWGE